MQNKIKKRMSFESPVHKDAACSNNSGYQNLSLLNYMLFKEKKREERAMVSATTMSKDQFLVLEILGKGGFGKVYKVEQKRTKSIFAMK